MAAAATAAAAAVPTTKASEKPQLAALHTPVSATYPSELRSPMVGTPTYIKQEEGLQKTPLTPPPAYLDFLKTLSPTLLSPQSTTRTSFPDRPGFPASHNSSSDTVVTLATDASDPTATASTLSRSTTSDTVGSIPASAASSSATASRSSSRSSMSRRDSLQQEQQQQDPTASTSFTSTDGGDPNKKMKIVIPPHSPFVRPHSARTPRRLYIPQSPRSAGVHSPMSARSLYSPYSATMSPLDAGEVKSPQVPLSAPLYGPAPKPVNVSVRQVVTRTVVYSSRTANGTTTVPTVDPVPPSKKRKAE